jgi:hypothetical protein
VIFPDAAGATVGKIRYGHGWHFEFGEQGVVIASPDVFATILMILSPSGIFHVRTM